MKDIDFPECNTNKKKKRLGRHPTLCQISHMSSSLAAVLQLLRQSRQCNHESKTRGQFLCLCPCVLMCSANA